MGNGTRSRRSQGPRLRSIRRRLGRVGPAEGRFDSCPRALIANKMAVPPTEAPPFSLPTRRPCIFNRLTTNADSGRITVTSLIGALPLSLLTDFVFDAQAGLGYNEAHRSLPVERITMSNSADPRAQGPQEDEVRRAAGLDELRQRAGTGGDESTGVEPASAVGSPPAPNDVEQIHDELPGFADSFETPTEGGPGMGSEEG